MRNFQGTAQELQSLKEKAEDKARMDLEADQRRVAAMGRPAPFPSPHSLA